VGPHVLQDLNRRTFCATLPPLLCMPDALFCTLLCCFECCCMLAQVVRGVCDSVARGYANNFLSFAFPTKLWSRHLAGCRQARLQLVAVVVAVVLVGSLPNAMAPRRVTVGGRHFDTCSACRRRVYTCLSLASRKPGLFPFWPMKSPINFFFVFFLAQQSTGAWWRQGRGSSSKRRTAIGRGGESGVRWTRAHFVT